jgi:hypothetical protein
MAATSTAKPVARRRLPLRQRGQAIVFMLLTAGVIVMLGLFILNAGILTSEKMRLQNAADAVVYSVSTVEARDLNFTAYTNRAMVANEVAIGQLVGLMSWAAQFASAGPFMNFYIGPILSALEAGTLGLAAFFTVPMRALIGAVTVVGNTLRGVIQSITTAIIPVVAAINKVYSIAQRSFHLVSFLFSIFTIDEMIKQNADGAKLSGFGVIALAGHFLTYYGDLPPFSKSFVNSYRQDSTGFPPQPGPGPTSAEQKAGMERLASLVNDSRDPFTLDRDGGWSIPLIPEISFDFGIPIPIIGDCPGSLCIVYVDFAFGISIDRNGGTDLRYVTNGEQQLYNWSGVDTTAMNMRLKFIVEFFGWQVPIPIDISGGPPLAIGAAQAGRATGTRAALLGNPSNLPFAPPMSMLPEKGVLGESYPDAQVSGDMYGGSPEISRTPWFWASPIPAMGPTGQVYANNVGRGYPGLPRYNDTKGGPDPIDLTTGTFGFEAPYIMIGLVKDGEDIAQSQARGRFNLNSEYASDDIGSISKAEVYFSRPNDLSYFRRADNKIEYGSGFNPYWQARLVDTTYLDRVTALAMQQYQLWLPNLPLGPVIDDIDNILSLLP